MFIAGKITYKLVNFPVPCPIAGSKSSSFLGSIISFGWLKRHRTSERTTLQQSVCPPFSLNSSHVFWLKSHVWWLNIPTLHQPDVLCWDDYIPRQNTGETHIENLWAHEKNVRIRICQKKSYFLRDIPTLTHYSHIVSDIPSGSIYGVIIYIHTRVFSLFIQTFILSGILLWHSLWHSIWHLSWHSFWHVFWRFFRHLFWHSVWQSVWHSSWHLFWHSLCQWNLELAVEVRQCPLRSGARGWGPAVRTEIWSSRLKSGSAQRRK